MSLTSGAYKMQYLVQKIIPTPYALDLENYIFVNNKSHQTPFHKIVRYIILLSFVFCVIPLIVCRVLWLFFNWETFTIYHVDQIIVHLFLLGTSSVFLPACYTIHKYNTEIQYLVNQRCKIVPVVAELSHRFNFFILLPFLGKTSCFELFVYGLSSPFLFLVLGMIALPFTVTYEPIQWSINSSTILAKLVASCVYFAVLVYATTTVLSILLIMIIFLEGIVTYSSKLHFSRFPHSNLMGNKFRNCYQRYRTLQIFIFMGNSIVLDFLTILIFVGVLAASSAAFMTLKMYKLLNIIMYLLGPATTTLGVVLALLLTYLANFPRQNTILFKLYWKQFMTTKENRRLLRACAITGFNLGPYGIAKASLGLHICDDIIRNTVTMLVLGPKIS